jgi:hypothetical protein
MWRDRLLSHQFSANREHGPSSAQRMGACYRQKAHERSSVISVDYNLELSLAFMFASFLLCFKLVSSPKTFTWLISDQVWSQGTVVSSWGTSESQPIPVKFCSDVTLFYKRVCWKRTRSARPCYLSLAALGFLRAGTFAISFPFYRWGDEFRGMNWSVRHSESLTGWSGIWPREVWFQSPFS